MHRVLLSLALAGVVFSPVALAADGPDVTIYSARNNALYQSGPATVDSGYAIIRESRQIGYDKGLQDLTIGNLPDYLEPEAVNLQFASSHVHVLSQRLLLAPGSNDSLIGQIGKPVSVIGDNGQILVKGTLKRVGRDGSLVISGDVFGPTVVQRYSAVKLIGGQIGSGSRLQVRIRASSSGQGGAVLSYPTHGLGWRAAYTAVLQAGTSCRMRLESQASIANRSGRDWNDADVKLIAGQPNMGGGRYYDARGAMNVPSPMAVAGAPLPRQAKLDAYRSYTLPGRIDLPDNSVTLTPLYSPRSLECERSWTYQTTGNTWIPPRPNTSASRNAATISGSIASMLRFEAHDPMPAGRVRVLSADREGHLSFIGEATMADTPEHTTANLRLGTAFDLRAQRQRTSFKYDRAAHRIDEAFQVTVTNSGDKARTVSVIEHPDRWNQWTLTSSSTPPAKQTPDTLEFHVNVPAHGSTNLDYALRYQWTAADQ